ncbi:monofunctional biosynthetic peptidoglycan transglycosylase [Chiayiivirga flava]|uniref:Biosynthetic peptidoglycan transglycosylase n=1 Tax=Chiayiivirga flava TaxID=659595 RepID=A0A7W8G0Y8_9GAMM|nr:monofunctional biosynthetic peptidoglycan transglycosylase [Chiayiivirga flava]MBB5208854.1 monofunctional biosynthetic peptidoglycan transglycosylase [Chiayiivirga flava]
MIPTPRPKPRWFRRLVLAALALLVLSALPVLLWRFVDPPTSAFMLARQIQARDEDDFVLRQTWVAFDAVSPTLPVALVAAEDQKFPMHGGFDVDAIRSVIDQREAGEASRGASTISQQVAKNLFLWSGRSWVRKGLEAYYTVLIELAWPKRRILEVYVNIVEFGDGVYGAEAAAQHFFGKSAAQLDASESALLAAVLPNPKVLRVDRPSAYVLRRQRWVARQVRQLGGPAHLRDCCG